MKCALQLQSKSVENNCILTRQLSKISPDSGDVALADKHQEDILKNVLLVSFEGVNAAIPLSICS